MTWERIAKILPDVPTQRIRVWTPAALREAVPALQTDLLSDEAIVGAEPLILTYMAQTSICNACQGYARCGKVGDAQGMVDTLTIVDGQLYNTTGYCRPFQEYLAVKRSHRYHNYSSRNDYDRKLTFDNFPIEQQKRRPKLFAAAVQFADTFSPGDDCKGLYVFGPAGVGKTHLMQAIVNRLETRFVPFIFVQAEALFDRLRSTLSDGEDLEPLLEAFSTVPVLAIDEFGQERANEFTLEKMFRIINHRFSAHLPTLFTSNYAPPDLYKRISDDLINLIDPLKSRVIGMSRVSYLQGEDFRTASMETLDF